MPSATPRLPMRRILELGDDFLGLLAGLNARHHDPACAQIECAGQWREPASGTRAMGTISLPRQAATISCKQVDVAASVLHIEDHEVEPAGREHGSDAGAEKLQHHLAEEQIPF